MTRDQSQKTTIRVHEVEVALDGDHQTHENTVTCFVVADSARDAQTKAGQLMNDERPEMITDQTTALHSGWKELDDAEWRSFIRDTQDDVLIGGDVPV